MTTNPDVLIIGGGLAGLAGALHLSKKGLKVMVIEKSGYPKHKVCGEYISNEVLPYLSWLGADVAQLNPVNISRFEFSSASGNSVSATLPLGGFGISRYALDHFLYVKAVEAGCIVIGANVTSVSFHNDGFAVTTPEGEYSAKIVLGAYGKRSNIDQQLSRDFMQKSSPWLAVKAHYSGDFRNDTVALHNFIGGYCGVSKVENGSLNICYLADYATFKKYRNINAYQQEVLYKNRHLKTVFENGTMLFDKPLTISQVSFGRKRSVENHILMTGDTAGLIHPLCGNGMAMAVHSAKIAAELVLDYYSGHITREQMEANYNQQWNRHFSGRLFMGRMLGKTLRNKTLTTNLLQAVVHFPAVLPKIIKQTHGNPILIND